MKSLILIGGPTACGKSTLVKSLNQSISGSVVYRRQQGFFDIAEQKKIPRDEIYSKVSSNEVDDWFVNICKKSSIVISDVHYAIQMSRNGINKNSNIDIHQEYVATISQNLLNKLFINDINVMAIYLYCSPHSCLVRAAARYEINQKDVRNISVEDAIIETYSEEKEWNNIISTNMVDGLKLNSELLSTKELTDQCLEYLEKANEKSSKEMILH